MLSWPAARPLTDASVAQEILWEDGEKTEHDVAALCKVQTTAAAAEREGETAREERDMQSAPQRLAPAPLMLQRNRHVRAPEPFPGALSLAWGSWKHAAAAAGADATGGGQVEINNATADNMAIGWMQVIPPARHPHCADYASSASPLCRWRQLSLLRIAHAFV